MTAVEQHTAYGKVEFYHSSFNDEEQLDFHQALDVVGYRQEVALIRVKIKYILKNMPSNITLLLRAIDALETLVRLQQKDKHDSLAGISKIMDTEFKGLVTPGKPVSTNLHELLAESTRPQPKKTASSIGVTPAANVPPASSIDTPPTADKKPDARVYPATLESTNTPSQCTENPDRYGMPHVEEADEKPLDVSIDESASIRNRQGLGACPEQSRMGEVITSQISSQRPVPQFQHSISLFRRKKSRKKR
jgi:hypothetical protein